MLASPQWLTSEQKVDIRPRDLDGNGHVNHAAIIEIFEAGRWHWMAANAVAHGLKIVPVVTKLEVNYHREVNFASVILHTAVHIPTLPDDTQRLANDEYDLVYRLIFAQSIATATTALAVAARIEVVFIDTQARRPASLSDFLEQNLLPPNFHQGISP